MSEPWGDGARVSEPWQDGARVRIAHVSDLHAGAEEGAAFGPLVEDLHAADVAATVVTGDLTMRARTAQFESVTQALAAFPKPLLVVPGNHDISLTHPIRRLTHPYERYRRHTGQGLDPLLDLGPVRIQGLTSMPPWRWKSGHISARQDDLVRQAFADADQAVVRIVALHHPLSSPDLERLAGRRRFEEALVDAGVDILLSGHTHVPAAQVLQIWSGHRQRDIVEVIAGTATSHRVRGVPRSWSLLEVRDATLVVRERLAEGGAWVAGTEHRFHLPGRGGAAD